MTLEVPRPDQHDQHGSSESRERPLSGKVALITGSSRDIGAGIVIALVREGAQILGNYREKEKRASEFDLAIRSIGGRIESVQADIIVSQEREKLSVALNESFGGRLDYLILNTSGNQQTARQVCVEANNALVDEFLSRMNEGGKIVLMQSVPGHFAPQLQGLGRMPDFYEPIADAKHEGEQLLRSRITSFAEKGVSFVVICPPEVEDTFNMKVFKRQDPLVSEKNAEISDMLGIPRVVRINDVGQKVLEVLKRKDLPMGYVELFSNVLDARSILSEWYGDNAIFVDTLEITDENHGVGRMIVAKEYTRGHFNEKVGIPVLPGHIMIEAAAQTLGLLALKEKVGENSMPIFQRIRAVEFINSVGPGEGLRVYAEVEETSRRGLVGDVYIKNMKDERVAEIMGIQAMVVSKGLAKRLLSR